jgi:hypothetical protein
MKISQGFTFITLAILGWVAACMLLDYFFPKPTPTYLSWYGEVHFEPYPNYPPEAEIGRTDIISDMPRQESPGDDKGAQ